MKEIIRERFHKNRLNYFGYAQIDMHKNFLKPLSMFRKRHF